MPDHSPTPWRVCENTGQIYDADGELVCCDIDDQKRPHIDFPHIVRCVNLHEALVAALDEALDYVCQHEGEGCLAAGELHDKIDSLLAKAKGEA